MELDETWLTASEKSIEAIRNREVPQSLADMEKAHILKVLEYTDWNYGDACQILGISRPTLRKKIAAYGLASEAGANGTK